VKLTLCEALQKCGTFREKSFCDDLVSLHRQTVDQLLLLLGILILLSGREASPIANAMGTLGSCA